MPIGPLTAFIVAFILFTRTVLGPQKVEMTRKDAGKIKLTDVKVEHLYHRD